MNIEHYQRLLECFDTVLDVFPQSERDLEADDASLRRNLLLLRARVAKTELEHPFDGVPVTEGNDTLPPFSVRRVSFVADAITDEHSTSPITILIADDDECVRRLARTILEASGEFSVVAEAEDGWQAVQLAITYAPDVILMDLEMPVIDGERATELILKVLPDLKVVIHTGNPSSSSRARAIAAGATGYLLKPAKRDCLLEELRKAHRGEDGFASGETARTDTQSAGAAAHHVALPSGRSLANPPSAG